MEATAPLKALEQRVEKLELSRRRWKAGALAILLLGALAILTAQTESTPSVVDAERFVLRDADGTIRGEWRVDTDGSGVIHLSGGKWGSDIWLKDGGDQSYPGLHVLSPTGQIAQLAIWADGAPGLHLSGDSSEAGLSLNTQGAAFLNLTSKGPGQRSSVEMKASAADSGSADLIINVGSRRLELGSGWMNWRQYLGLLIHDGRWPRLVLALDEEDAPSLAMYDDSLRTRTVLGVTDLAVISTGETRTRPASSLVLFGTDGKVIWKVP